MISAVRCAGVSPLDGDSGSALGSTWKPLEETEDDGNYLSFRRNIELWSIVEISIQCLKVIRQIRPVSGLKFACEKVESKISVCFSVFCGWICVCSYFRCLGPPQGLLSCLTAPMNHLLSGILYLHRWEWLGVNHLAHRSWITSCLILGRVAGWGDREPCSFKSQISTYPPCSSIPGRAHRHRRQLSSSMQVNSIMHLWWALKYHRRRHMVCPHRRPLCCCTTVWKMLRF